MSAALLCWLRLIAIIYALAWHMSVCPSLPSATPW